MKSLGMIREAVEGPERPPRTARASSWLRARRSGFCEVTVRLGATVEKGDTVAVTFDALGRDRSMVKAKESGVLIAHVTSPIVNRGDAVAHVARVDP